MSTSACDMGETAGSSGSSVVAFAIARQRPSTCPEIFSEHWLAHELLDGLSGLEQRHDHVGKMLEHLAREHEVLAPIGDRDAIAHRPDVHAGRLDAHGALLFGVELGPFPAGDISRLESKRVVGGRTDPEWNLIVRDGGYVFMIVPASGALPRTPVAS